MIIRLVIEKLSTAPPVLMAVLSDVQVAGGCV